MKDCWNQEMTLISEGCIYPFSGDGNLIADQYFSMSGGIAYDNIRTAPWAVKKQEEPKYGEVVHVGEYKIRVNETTWECEEVDDDWDL